MQVADPDPGLYTRHLKDCLDALEKLHAIRRELKARLQRDGLLEDDEVRLAQELVTVSTQIRYLESRRLVPPPV